MDVITYICLIIKEVIKTVPDSLSKSSRSVSGDIQESLQNRVDTL